MSGLNTMADIIMAKTIMANIIMAKTIMTKANLLYPRLPTRPVIRRPGNPVYCLGGLAIGNEQSKHTLAKLIIMKICMYLDKKLCLFSVVMLCFFVYFLTHFSKLEGTSMRSIFIDYLL